MSDRIRVWIGVCVCAGVFWGVFIVSIFPHPEPFDEQLEAFGKISGSDDLWHKGIRFHQLKEFESAMKSYDAALELNPESTFALLYRGRLKYDQEDYEGAAADYTRALEIDSHFGSAINARIVARYRTGDKEGAESDVQRYIEHDPGANLPLINRAVMMRLDGDSEGARAEFEQIRADTPEGEKMSRRLLENLGALKFEEGDFEGALSEYNLVIERDPYSFRYYASRAEIYLALNQPEKAEADRERYREFVRLYNAAIRKELEELNPKAKGDLNGGQ